MDSVHLGRMKIEALAICVSFYLVFAALAWVGPQKIGADVSYPHGLAFDGSGNLFVADSGNGTILKFTPGGAQSTFASGLECPSGLAFDGNGHGEPEVRYARCASLSYCEAVTIVTCENGAKRCCQRDEKYDARQHSTRKR